MGDISYLYVFEDGTIGIHHEPPTNVDLQLVDNGTLRVLQCCGEVFDIESDGDVFRLPVAAIRDEEHGRYHFMKDDWG